MNILEAKHILKSSGYNLSKEHTLNESELDEGFKDWVKTIKSKIAGFTKKKLEKAMEKALEKDGIESLKTVLEKLKKSFPERSDEVDNLAAKINEIISSAKSKETEDDELNKPLVSANEAFALKYDAPELNEAWSWEFDMSNEHGRSHIFMLLAHLIVGWAVNFFEAFSGHDEVHGGKLDWLERVLSFFAGMRDLGLLVGVLMAGISILLVLSGVPAKELMGIYAERIGDAVNFLTHLI